MRVVCLACTRLIDRLTSVADKAACADELADVRKRDKEVTTQHNQKMKGAFLWLLTASR